MAVADSSERSGRVSGRGLWLWLTVRRGVGVSQVEAYGCG